MDVCKIARLNQPSEVGQRRLGIPAVEAASSELVIPTLGGRQRSSLTHPFPPSCALACGQSLCGVARPHSGVALLVALRLLCDPSRRRAGELAIPVVLDDRLEDPLGLFDAAHLQVTDPQIVERLRVHAEARIFVQ